MVASVAARTGRRRLVGTAGIAGLATLALGGCNTQASNGFLPSAVSDSGRRVTDLWLGSWMAVLAVGVITWGLIIYAAIRYRRRKDDDGSLPVQLRYNVPLELLYTVIPVFMIAVFFYYTARDESALVDTSTHKDLTVSVVAKQWSWDFNYVDSNVHESGVHTDIDGSYGKRAQMPVLYLPVNKRVEFVLNSRDVVHSFWIPAFIMKMDIIPGKTNAFQVTPTQVGTFQGKCAEFCGAYHSQMLFMVKVVPQNEYDQEMAHLRSIGQEGLIPVDVSREKMVAGDIQKIPAPARTESNQ